MNLIAPSLGYPTDALEEVYVERGLRFGCWACTVVREDRTMRRLIQETPRLIPLLEFRDWLVSFARDPGNRVIRPDGVPGRLTLEARRAILHRLGHLEEATGMRILSPEERSLILDAWRDPRFGNEYTQERRNHAHDSHAEPDSTQEGAS